MFRKQKLQKEQQRNKKQIYEEKPVRAFFLKIKVL